MKCKNCSIEIKSLSRNCPLCGKHLSGDTSPTVPYPKIKSPGRERYPKSLRIILFSAITASIALLAVNLLTYENSLWSIIPISSVWLAFLILGLPITLRRITPFMIIMDNVILSFYLVIVDVATGYTGWAMGYAVPLMLFGSSLTVTIIVMCTRMTLRKFFLFQLAIAVICFIPLIMREFFDFVFWPSIVSAAYGFLTILGMLIFGDKKLRFEAKKRYHI